MPRLGQAAAGEVHHRSVTPDSAPALVTLAALQRQIRRGPEARDRAGGAAPGPIRPLPSVIACCRVGAHAGRAARRRRRPTPTPVTACQAGRAVGRGAAEPAIARRGGDAGALATHWSAGMDVLAEYSIDLFSPLPVGEVSDGRGPPAPATAAAAPALEQAFGLLDALRASAGLVTALHWAGVRQDAGRRSGGSGPHGQALAAMVGHSPFCRGPGRCGIAPGCRCWPQPGRRRRWWLPRRAGCPVPDSPRCDPTWPGRRPLAGRRPHAVGVDASGGPRPQGQDRRGHRRAADGPGPARRPRSGRRHGVTIREHWGRRVTSSRNALPRDIGSCSPPRPSVSWPDLLLPASISGPNRAGDALLDAAGHVRLPQTGVRTNPHRPPSRAGSPGCDYEVSIC